MNCGNHIIGIEILKAYSGFQKVFDNEYAKSGNSGRCTSDRDPSFEVAALTIFLNVLADRGIAFYGFSPLDLVVPSFIAGSCAPVFFGAIAYCEAFVNECGFFGSLRVFAMERTGGCH